MSDRILARADDPVAKCTELAWVQSRERLLGESFATAYRRIQEMVDSGEMIVIPPVEEYADGRDFTPPYEP